MLKKFVMTIRNFLGRSSDATAEAPVPQIRSDSDHNLVYRQGTDLVQPYMWIHALPEKSVQTPDAQRNLRRGISLLRAVTRYAPDNWNAYWIMGKAFQTLGERQLSYEAFKRAFEIRRGNADVAREYMFACLDLGIAVEGIAAAQHAVSLKESDPGLHANLALAYLIAGQHADADKCIDESLRLNPSDTISRNVKVAIREVIEGKRRQPKNMGDL